MSKLPDAFQQENTFGVEEWFVPAGSVVALANEEGWSLDIAVMEALGGADRSSNDATESQAHDSGVALGGERGSHANLSPADFEAVMAEVRHAHERASEADSQLQVAKARLEERQADIDRISSEQEAAAKKHQAEMQRARSDLEQANKTLDQTVQDLQRSTTDLKTANALLEERSKELTAREERVASLDSDLKDAMAEVQWALENETWRTRRKRRKRTKPARDDSLDGN